MSSAWRIQSGRDVLGTIRTSPYQIEQTCASFSAVRTIGQGLSRATFGDAGEVHGDSRVRPLRGSKGPFGTEYLTSPVVSDVVITE